MVHTHYCLYCLVLPGTAPCCAASATPCATIWGTGGWWWSQARCRTARRQASVENSLFPKHQKNKHLQVVHWRQQLAVRIGVSMHSGTQPYSFFLRPVTRPPCPHLCCRAGVESNGAGKTALTMAPLWALTGSVDSRAEVRRPLGASAGCPTGLALLLPFLNALLLWAECCWNTQGWQPTCLAFLQSSSAPRSPAPLPTPASASAQDCLAVLAPCCRAAARPAPCWPTSSTTAPARRGCGWRARSTASHSSSSAPPTKSERRGGGGGGGAAVAAVLLLAPRPCCSRPARLPTLLACRTCCLAAPCHC